MAKGTQIICKNIFRSSNETAFRKEYTQKWIELINRLEKDKKHTSSERQDLQI